MAPALNYFWNLIPENNHCCRRPTSLDTTNRAFIEQPVPDFALQQMSSRIGEISFGFPHGRQSD
jgi:hypothetical protein